MRSPCAPRALPRSTTVSPSSRKLRCVPSGICNGCAPDHESSSMEPYEPASLPLTVPVPSKSPGRRLQPVSVCCVTICEGLQ
eukprot:1260935-Pleurochrysis_carterae.AAC.1